MFYLNPSLLSFFVLFLSFAGLQAQNDSPVQNSRKVFTAERIEQAPDIDGVLDDAVWEDKTVATDFLMFEPGDGEPARETHRTEVKVLYDDDAIYIAAYMFDNDPERILRQFTQRDNLGQADHFAIDINTYDDAENQTRFIVTSAGAIADARVTGNRDDFNYNVVWEAEISYDLRGWYAEIRIPYAALRFPEKEEQQWGIQFLRKITHLNEVYTWNYVNRSVGKFTQYNGLIEGIKDIAPPIRLSFYPYTSAEADHFGGKTRGNFSAGMDVKYGITDGFTLDATLIPDFGQTAFDQVELNLGPFEQVFSENRAFFTEGTELFTKGNLFFSRRIGDTPVGFNDAQRQLLDNEVILENPEITDLLNALKISGRTSKNLGIGFFNAVTSETLAVIEDTIAGRTREIVTEPLANYNILVLDQRFAQNSSVTLINTSVLREGRFRDANVSGLLFDVFNGKNSFNFTGEAKMSILNRESYVKGFSSSLGVDRTKGKIRYGVSHNFADDTYDINDMGLNFRNNFNNFSAYGSYQIFEPVGMFNEYRVSLSGRHRRRYDPDVVERTSVEAGLFAVTRTRFAFGGGLEGTTKFRDYFEPRIRGSFITYNESLETNAWVSSDYRKLFAYDVRLGYNTFLGSEQEFFRVRVRPRLRFSDKFSMIYTFNYNTTKDRESFVERQENRAVFASRDNQSLENALQASYNFNNKQGLNLNFRNFWSIASFDENSLAYLQPDGTLDQQGNIKVETDPDVNFNIWNLDLSYRWQFAPGSEAVLLYRNSIFNIDGRDELGYIPSLENLFAEPLRQNISLRVVYFLDYSDISRVLRS